MMIILIENNLLVTTNHVCVAWFSSLHVMKKARQDCKQLLFVSAKPFMEACCVYFTIICTEFLITPPKRI